MSIRDPQARPRPRRGIVRGRRGDLYDTAPVRPARDVAPPSVPPPDPRSTISWLSGLNGLAGIWLIIAPWVLGYSAADPKWNDVVFGAIVAVLAFTRSMGAYRADVLSWINAAIGIWIFIAAFTIDSTATAGWNDIILGIIVFVLAVTSADATADLLPARRPRPMP